MMKKKRTFLYSILLITIFSVLFACARSENFQNDSKYYKEDSRYSARSGNEAGETTKWGQPKTRLFVLPFKNDTPLSSKNFGIVAANELLRKLSETGKAVIPDDIKVSVNSSDFYVGDKIKLTPLLKEAKRLGVALIAVGKINRIVYRRKGDNVGLFASKKAVAIVDMEIRVFSATEGKEVFYKTRSADSSASHVDVFGTQEKVNIDSQRTELVKEAIRAGVPAFSNDIQQVLEKMSWQGRIAKVSAGKIFINAGRSSGLNVGDILKVMTQGEDVFDPVTGNYMGRSKGQPKGTLEIVDFLGSDGSVASVHSGGGFFENDIVQLY